MKGQGRDPGTPVLSSSSGGDEPGSSTRLLESHGEHGELGEPRGLGLSSRSRGSALDRAGQAVGGFAGRGAAEAARGAWDWWDAPLGFGGACTGDPSDGFGACPFC